MIPITWYFPVNFTTKNYVSKLHFKENKISILERGFSFGLTIGKRPFWDVEWICFSLWNKKLTIEFFGVEFTGDYRNVAIIPILCRDHRRKLRKPNFS